MSLTSRVVIDTRVNSMTCEALEIANRVSSAVVDYVSKASDCTWVRPRRPVTGAMPRFAWNQSDIVAMSTRRERALRRFGSGEIVSQSKCLLDLSIMNRSTG